MTFLHARVAAILAGDLPPDIRDVIEELEALTVCPTCGGDGIDGSHDAARYYAYSGEISLCPTCDGTGRPAEPASPSTDSEAGQ